MKSEDGPEEDTAAAAEEFLASLKEVMDEKRIVEQEDKVGGRRTTPHKPLHCVLYLHFLQRSALDYLPLYVLNSES